MSKQGVRRAIVGVAAVAWSWNVVAVAVFAVPRAVEGFSAVLGSLLVVAVGLGVPAAVIYYTMIRTLDSTARDKGASKPTSVASDASLTTALAEPLSPRELEVLERLAVGASNQEIARHFVIEVATVKSHTNSLYRKLGARNRTEAVARARAHRLI